MVADPVAPAVHLRVVLLRQVLLRVVARVAVAVD